jgi:DNA polymerase I-like protein with 3'-5' exonuclease and polymerase domains/uracil-DNA glycosylase
MENKEGVNVLKCDKCKFGGKLKDDTTKFVPGKGNPKADIMVISDYPDKLASYKHEPFMDEAAAAIDFAMFDAKIIERNVSKHKRLDKYVRNGNRYKNVYYTTALKCFPSLGAGLTASNISGDERNMCRRTHLVREIRSVRPKFILTIGNESLKMVRNSHYANAMNDRGFWEYNEEFDCNVFPIPTHFSLTSAWEVTSPIFREIQQFGRDIKAGVPTYKLGDNYGVIEKIETARKFFKFLKKRKRVAFDFETSSLRYWDMDEEPLGLSFCWKTGNARYIPFTKGGDEGRASLWSDADRLELRRLIKDFFENTPDIKKDGQNMKFDINWLHHEGVHNASGFDWDTMQFHHLIDENTPSNLTYLTCYYNIKFPHYDTEIAPYIRNKGKDKDKTKEKTYEFIPRPLIAKYGCADVDAVWRIRIIQQKYASDRQTKLYYNVSVPLSIFTRSIERKGVRINIEEIDKLERQYTKKIDTKKKQLSAYVNEKSFNCNSNPQMQKLLFEKLTLYSPFKTKSGKPSTGADAFERIERTQGKKVFEVGGGKKIKVATLFKKIIELRAMGKMKSTYLTGMRLLADDNARVHTSYLTTGTVTGRSSSRGPNLQNIPRDPIFRSLFIAGPNRFLIPADYSQIEARLLPFLAKEVKYVLQFQDPSFDPHSYNSASYRNKEVKDVTKEERSHDKAITFGINYGRSNKSIADEYQLSIEDVNEKVETYFKNNPRMAKWRKNRALESQNKLKMCEGRTDYYVENALGRRRHFSLYKWVSQPELLAVDALRGLETEEEVSDNYRIMGLRGNAERQAVNFPIQSYASDILTMASYRVYKRCRKEKLDAFLVLTVHDMIALDTHESCKEQAMRIVNEELPIKKSFMERGERIELAFPADCELTPHWVQ